MPLQPTSPAHRAMLKITEARIQQHMSLNDLAEKLQDHGLLMSFDQVAACADGRTQKIQFNMIHACGKILGISPDDLMPDLKIESHPRWDDLDYDDQQQFIAEGNHPDDWPGGR